MVSVEEKIKEIINSKIGLESTKESKFTEDLGCDSLDILEIVLSVEKEFNISIPDAKMDHLKTVQDLVNYVQEHI